MQQDDPWHLELDSDRFMALCRFLSRTTLQADASLRYDVMSGGYRFSDESPLDSLRDFDEDLILPLTTLLRFLWAYRISVIRGVPRVEFAKWWDSTKALAPSWPGFSQVRCSDDGKQFAAFCDARQKAWEEGVEVMQKQWPERDKT